MVRDLKKNRDILLNEASTGTKVNLLISAKLALLEISERSTDVNFPIIFDDALAVADGSAKKAIAETLRIIAEQGRQVICLTADESDAELLETYGGKRVEITPATD